MAKLEIVAGIASIIFTIAVIISVLSNFMVNFCEDEINRINLFKNKNFLILVALLLVSLITWITI